MEALVALTVILVGMLGVFALISQSLGLTRVVADRYVASNLAAEGVEIVKNIIDTNYLRNQPWNTGLAPGDYEVDYQDSSLGPNLNRNLNFDSNTGLYSYRAGQPSRFQREIKISWSSDGQQVQVNSIVRWITRGGGNFDVNVEDHFFNWRK